MSDLATIADAVDALTNPIRIREPIYERINGHRQLTRVWEATAPPLLTQLRAAVQPGVAYTEDEAGNGHATPQSVPPARIDAINALLRIEADLAMWCYRIGLTPRETASATMRALVGAPMTSDDAAELLTHLRHWHGWAATLSGWQRPAWRPDAACPACDAKHALRVRLERKSAVCVECGVYWVEATIGVLGEYITSVTASPTVDTKHLRTIAVHRRRLEDAKWSRVFNRPDLPYTNVEPA